MFEIESIEQPFIYEYFGIKLYSKYKYIAYIATDYDGSIHGYCIEPIFDWNTLVWEYDDEDPIRHKRYIQLGKAKFIGNPSKSLISYV